jgi:hypothetical protein
MSSTLLSGYFGQQLILEPFRFLTQPHEYKVVALRECPAPDAKLLADTPQKLSADTMWLFVKAVKNSQVTTWPFHALLWGVVYFYSHGPD